jgi:hypothetical protein
VTPDGGLHEQLPTVVIERTVYPLTWDSVVEQAFKAEVVVVALTEE